MLLSGLWFELVSLLVPVSSLSMRLVLYFVLCHSFSVFCSSLPTSSFFTSQLHAMSDLCRLPVSMTVPHHFGL